MNLEQQFFNNSVQTYIIIVAIILVAFILKRCIVLKIILRSLEIVVLA